MIMTSKFPMDSLRRRLWIAPVLAALAALALGAPSAAQDRADQTDDGWDYSETGGVHLASVAYDEGRAIGVRCSRGALEVLFLGLALPPTQRVDTVMLDVAVDDHDGQQTWLTIPGQPALFSARPAYLARRLRDAAVISLQIEDQTPRLKLPLPSDGASVDRVLSACGQPLADSRDDLPEIGPRPDDAANSIWKRLPNLSATAADARYDFIVVSCVVAPDHRLTACRPEVQQPSGRAGASAARAFESGRLNPDAAVPEGRLLVALVTPDRR